MLDDHRPSTPDSINEGHLEAGRMLPLVITPAGGEAVEPGEWAKRHREFIESRLAAHGGLLFRGFAIREAAEFEQFVEAACGELIEYQERSSPRSTVSGRVYTSTDHPASRSIFPHNEQSYNTTFPMKIIFFCHTPAPEGGGTPVGDTRKIFQGIDPRIKDRFAQKKYMYVRNYNNGVGLSWQQVFQTSERSVVEDYCRRSEIEFEWRGADGLRTRQVRPAFARHPRTGEWVWFNHATFFHISTLEPALQSSLLQIFSEDDLPNNTYYGDGSRIEASVLEELRAAYRQAMTVFPWQQGDILLLDNMLTAHAREPFRGTRKILTAMAEPRRWHTL